MNIALQVKDNANFDKLYIAFELSNKKWKVGFSNGQKRRIKTVQAKDWEQLTAEIKVAKRKLFCKNDCEIVSCYEAGRDGFWIHRALEQEGIHNLVIDSGSIEVNRKKRRAKSDTIDVVALLRFLMRYDTGEHEALRVAKVPSVEEEDIRRLSRERERLISERTGHNNRIKSLLVLHGIAIDKITDIPALLPTAKACVTGYDLPMELRAEIEREYKRYQLIAEQIKELEKLRLERLKTPQNKTYESVNRLMQLRGVGYQTGWVVIVEFFGWRTFKNRKQVASCAGLTPTPYDSGDSCKEQGISKASARLAINVYGRLWSSFPGYG